MISEYRKLITKLGMTQACAAKFLEISLRTSAGYAAGETEAPKATLTLLRVLLAITTIESSTGPTQHERAAAYLKIINMVKLNIKPKDAC